MTCLILCLLRPRDDGEKLPNQIAIWGNGHCRAAVKARVSHVLFTAEMPIITHYPNGVEGIPLPCQEAAGREPA